MALNKQQTEQMVRVLAGMVEMEILYVESTLTGCARQVWADAERINNDQGFTVEWTPKHYIGTGNFIRTTGLRLHVKTLHRLFLVAWDQTVNTPFPLA